MPLPRRDMRSLRTPAGPCFGTGMNRRTVYTLMRQSFTLPDIPENTATRFSKREDGRQKEIIHGTQRIYLYSPAFKNIKKVSCDVTYDGNCYIVSNVKCKYARAENEIADFSLCFGSLLFNYKDGHFLSTFVFSARILHSEISLAKKGEIWYTEMKTE